MENQNENNLNSVIQYTQKFQPDFSQVDLETKKMLFVSFDVCNSTGIKHEVKNWLEIANILISNKMPSMTFWKFNGDEVLYYEEVFTLKHIMEILPLIHQQLITLQNLLEEKTKTKIFVKSTVWCAEVGFKFRKNFENIDNYEFNSYPNFPTFRDYIGANIDEGFRLCGSSSACKLVVDPKLVYMIFKLFMDENEYRLRGISEQDLQSVLSSIYFYNLKAYKGIWNGKKYPTYWYIPKDLNKAVSYSEVFDLSHFYSVNKDIKSSFNSLERIFDEVGILEKVNSFYESFKNEKRSDITRNTESVANLYYMVTCINPKTGNVMLAKRSKKRKHLKGVWDFGNVKYQKIDMVDVILKKYENTFGIKLSIDLDQERDNNIVPYGCCTIYRNCNPHNGILCHAIIDSPNGTDEELINAINDHIKEDVLYDEVKFISCAEAEIISKNSLTLNEIRDDSEFANRNVSNPCQIEDKCIMYVDNSVRSAHNFYIRWKEKSEKK